MEGGGAWGEVQREPDKLPRASPRGSHPARAYFPLQQITTLQFDILSTREDL